MSSLAPRTKRRFIARDDSRTEHDDFVLHVAPKLGILTEAMPVIDASGELIGWFIQPRYE